MTQRARRWLFWAGALATLAAVSVSYLNPHLMLELADRLWACF